MPVAYHNGGCVDLWVMDSPAKGRSAPLHTPKPTAATSEGACRRMLGAGVGEAGEERSNPAAQPRSRASGGCAASDIVHARWRSLLGRGAGRQRPHSQRNVP